MDKLRGHTSGLAVPYFVIDAPGGGGKIPLLPQYVIGRNGNQIILRNYNYDIFVYEDVEDEKTHAVEQKFRRKNGKAKRLKTPEPMNPPEEVEVLAK